MYCNNCGTKLPDNAKYCHNCGSEFINTEPIQNDFIYTPEVIKSNNKETVVEIEVDGSKKIAVWSIIVYASIFYILSQFLSSFIISIYCIVKEIPILEVEDIASYLLTYYPKDYYNILAISNLVCYLPILITLVLISIRIFGHDLKKIKNHVGRFFANFGIGFAILYGASLASSIVVTILIELYNLILINNPALLESFGAIESVTSGNQETINNMVNSGILPFITMVFVTVIAAPIVEELVFRKSFFALSKKKGIACILISGLIFGSIHVAESVLVQVMGLIQDIDGYSITNIIIEFINLISYVASGIAFGIIYKKSNYNIWVTILIHATYNLMGFFALFLV